MRRLLSWALVGLLLFVVLPGAADGQSAQSSASPIVGSGSFGGAPLVTPGTRYEDSIRPNEVIYYAVRLEAGQTASARLRLVEESDGTSVSASFFDPLRRYLVDSDMVYAGEGGSETLRTPVVAPMSVSRIGEDDAFGPGIWFLEVSALNPIYKRSDRYEVPFSFQVDVEGAPAESSTPTPTPTPTPTAVKGDDSGEGGKPSVALVGGLSGAGLLLGGLGTARIRRR